MDFTSPGQFVLGIAFNFKESESDKKTLNGWNGTVGWILRAQDSSCSWLLSILESLKANKKTPGGYFFVDLVSKAQRSIKGCNEELF